MSSQFKSTEYVLRVLRDADVEVSHMNEDEGCIWLAIPVDNPVEDEDSVMKQEDTLYIPEFAHGYLLSESYMIFHQLGDIDGEDWQQVNDTPLYAGEHCEYADYDLNFWYSEEEDKWHCTAYEIWRDEESVAHTKTDEWRRLW